MNKRILMTGATGFLGSNLLISLVNIGYKVSILKRVNSKLIRILEVLEKIDTYNIEEISIADCLRKSQPNIIIHCATDYGRKNADPSSIIEANLILPLKLLELSRSNNVNCFINTDTVLDKRINHYSLSKKQFKDWLNAFSADLICINISLEHFYGPFDDKTKFVSFIIDKFISEAKEIDLTLGEQKRDFIFIDDIISAFNIVIYNLDKMQLGFYEYEIGTTKQFKIKELIEIIKKLTGNINTKTNYGVIPYRKNEIMESNVNIKEISRLGWSPKYDLYMGLKKTIETELKSKL